MSDDLLAKEKEYHRLNKELEQKNRDLMKEINTVLNSNAGSSTFQMYSSHTDTAEKVSNLKPVLITRREQLNVAINKEDSPNYTCSQDTASSLRTETVTLADGSANNVNKKDRITNKAVIDFLKAKIEMLQTELQTNQLEYKKKVDYCKELEANNKKLANDKIRLSHQLRSLKETIGKLENKNSNLHTQHETLNSVNLQLTKDIDDLRKDFKVVNQKFHSYELRLNKALEDNEKMCVSLKSSQETEKDLRSHINKLECANKFSIKNFEKQRLEILHAFQKQTLLVENLKKQNACLLLVKQIELYETDFNKLLGSNDLDIS